MATVTKAHVVRDGQTRYLEAEDTAGNRIRAEITPAQLTDLAAECLIDDLAAKVLDNRPLNAEEIDVLRQESADGEFEIFDFGAPVKDTGGWEMNEPNVMERSVFLEPDNEEPSVRVRFKVTFHSKSAEVVHAEVC